MTRSVVVLLGLVAAGCGGGDSSAPGGSNAAGTPPQVSIQNKGSDTLVNVAQAWAEKYHEINPDVSISVSGGGSGTGISALINGSVDVANASRKMKDSEIAQAKAKGNDPVEFTVGHDALAVYVHRDNPVESLTLAQLAQIYGEGGTAEAWGDLGIKVPGAKDGKIVRVSRQNNSGTYEYFREAILGKKDFKLGSLDMQGSKDVVDLVEKTPGAIGYSGLAYATAGVKMVRISAGEGKPAVAATIVTALDGTYPIARPLFMYSRGQPAGEVKKYLDWILSDAGQRIIEEMGYAPVRVLAKK